MKVKDLKQKLLSEGCSESIFAILSRKSDAFCLNKKDGKWAVFYSERGRDSNPIYTSNNEEDACKFFFNYILKQQHWHIVGFFKTESEAIKLGKKLKAIGIEPIRNDIPAYKTANDPRYRVFVVGKDIFKVREKLGNIQGNYT